MLPPSPPRRPGLATARSGPRQASPPASTWRFDGLATTPAKLLDKLRIEHARTLLATSDLALKPLAAHCGFGNPARMNRAFERELGMTPRAYRIMHAT